jgi:hypothetical protein
LVVRSASRALILQLAAVKTHGPNARLPRLAPVKRNETDATLFPSRLARPAEKMISKITPDRSKIAIEREDQVKYWTRHFGVTKDELARAIERVGNSAAAVRKELGVLETSTT